MPGRLPIAEFPLGPPAVPCVGVPLLVGLSVAVPDDHLGAIAGALEASRHLLPYTCSCLLEVTLQRWLLPPAQSHNWTCVPFVVLEFGTSTHLWGSRTRPLLLTWPFMRLARIH
jgi:hypothetical protein